MRSVWVALGLLAVSLVSPMAVGQGSLVPNAGMEEGDTGPSRWSWSAGEGGQGEYKWETGGAHSGQRCFRVTKLGSVGYTALVSDFVPVQPGHTYEVSAWVYPLRPVTRGVYFMICQHPAEGKPEQLPNTFGNTTERLLGGQWQRLTVLVPIREGNTRITIHCIQAFGPSDVRWDDFAVGEPAPAPPPRYEPPVKETLPDLAPAQAALRARGRAQVKVETGEGRPRLFVDGKPVPWAFYVGPFWNHDDAQIADFRNAGVRVYLVPLILGHDVYADRGPWLGKDRYDFSEVDNLLWRVLRVDPQGYILFYMGCDPYREWGAENLDQVTQDQNGRKAIVDMHPKRWGDDPKPPERFGPSPFSLRLRQETAVTLRLLTQHVESSEAGKAVIGYHVAGFNDGQWFAWERLAEDDLHLADYCPGAQEAFREWLKRRYGGDLPALRRAWNRPEVTFEAAAIPAGDRYWAKGFLLDPRTQQDVADYTRFFSEGSAETVEYLASVLKASTKRRILCGTYYEDITCNVDSHIALGRHLASDSLDYLAGPAAYNIRMPGCPGAVRDVFGSTLLHGKTYLTEQDWRSWHSAPDSPENNFAWGRAETGAAHNAMVRRECGMMLAFGLGTWWYDMSGGWFRDDQIMSGIAEALRAFGRDLSLPGTPRGDLAVFVSEESNDYVCAPAAAYMRYQGIVQQIEQLNTAGVPYRLYLQSDLGRVKLPEHRAYLFLNSYYLTDVQRRAIEGLKRDGKLLAFVRAPGVIGAPVPAEAVAAITGLKTQVAEGVSQMMADPVAGDHPLLRDLEGCLGTSPGPPGLVFAVTDERATPLAHYAGTPLVSVAARDFGAWKSVFIGCPGISAQFVHNLARWAGCWCAAETGDAVYANEHFATIHALYSGHKTLQLARPSRVVDLTSGRVVADNARTVECDLERGETRWFFLESR